MLNIGKLKAAHRRFLPEHYRLLEREIRDAQQFGLDHQRAHATFKTRTGKLQSGTRTRQQKLGRRRVVTFSNAVRYAHPIDLGARPHVIRARRARALRFFWPRVGRVVSFRSVNHPGNRAYRWLWRATRASGRIFEQGMSVGMQQIARKF